MTGIVLVLLANRLATLQLALVALLVVQLRMLSGERFELLGGLGYFLPTGGRGAIILPGSYLHF